MTFLIPVLLSIVQRFRAEPLHRAIRTDKRCGAVFAFKYADQAYPARRLQQGIEQLFSSHICDLLLAGVALQISCMCSYSCVRALPGHKNERRSMHCCLYCHPLWHIKCRCLYSRSWPQNSIPPLQVCAFTLACLILIYMPAITSYNQWLPMITNIIQHPHSPIGYERTARLSPNSWRTLPRL